MILLNIDLINNISILSQVIAINSRGNEDSACMILRSEIDRLRKTREEKSDGEMDDTKVGYFTSIAMISFVEM